MFELMELYLFMRSSLNARNFAGAESSLSDKPIFITQHWVTLLELLAKMCSIIAELLEVSLVGTCIDCLNRKNVQNSW